MITLPGKIPLRIRPFFWLTACLIGFLFAGGDLVQTVLWVGIVFISVLFHEWGHALMALVFGQKPQIELVALGGVTTHQGEQLSFGKQFLVALNGPFFGFLLGTTAYFTAEAPFITSPLLKQFLHNMGTINWLWTVINLLPVLPLDGGQLLRIVLESFFATKGVRYALLSSALLSFAFSLFLFLTQNFLIGAFFFLFAFENFYGFRASKQMRESDRDVHLQQALMDAQIELGEGHKKEALEAFEKIRAGAKEGIIYQTASQYAAYLEYESGRRHEAYETLKGLKENLDPEGLALLHNVAFEEKDYSLVAELSAEVFRLLPTAEIALRNAYAFAHQKQNAPTLGWLETAWEAGVQNFKEILQGTEFDFLRGDPHFVAFTTKVE